MCFPLPGYQAQGQLARAAAMQKQQETAAEQAEIWRQRQEVNEQPDVEDAEWREIPANQLAAPVEP